MSNSLESVPGFFQRHQNLLITVSLVLVALPFVALSFFSHPCLDDILDAVIVRKLGFWAAQKYFYVSHTGRYTTTVLLALVNPLIYTRLESNWWPMVLSFMLGTLLVLRLCLGTLLRIPNGTAWRGAGLLLCLWLAYAPGQAEGLYWFTGAYTYIASAWLAFIWLAAFAQHRKVRQRGQSGVGWGAALVGLTVAVAGTTEPVAFPFLLALLAGALLRWWRSRSLFIAALAALAMAGSIVSFTAPGNFARMSSMGESFGVVKTLLYSGVTTAYLLLTWAGNPLLLALSALLLPTLHRIARQRDQLLVGLLSHIPAGVLALFLSLLLAAANYPAFYASGTGLPLRARTTMYLFFVVGWFGVLLAWCCRQEQASAVVAALTVPPLRLVWMGLLVVFFFTDFNVQTRRRLAGNGSNNAMRAYQQWLGGDAARYDAELRARYQTLAAGRPTVTIYPLHTRPSLLYCFNVAGTRNQAFLRDYAYYFGVPQVLTTPEVPDLAQ
ncbi:DUF6056 family protein [Hymenobacter siberiensis]|uniref:DUF6056 family protein n=1 Tax=Hymenobacter siberiensis TaxID=2848396 RepID=UPI001F26C201|nr:DUF6056 family protein [Hymenobacter siberiensis]